LVNGQGGVTPNGEKKIGKVGKDEKQLFHARWSHHFWGK